MEKQDQVLKDKIMTWGYADVQFHAGQEDILMVYVQAFLICSVDYALSMDDDTLHALIDETVGL